jgi:DNA-binding HxlR family transcriptional regulator
MGARAADAPDAAAKDATAKGAAAPSAAAVALTDALQGRPCSIAAALRVVGDKWSLLIVRELLFGNHRFDQIATNTGGPRDRIAARLRELQAVGVVERRRYQHRPERFEYHLTAAGRELSPVLLTLHRWGSRWAIERPTAAFRHSCGAELRELSRCAGCGQPVRPAELLIESLAPGWNLAGPTGPDDEW